MQIKKIFIILLALGFIRPNADATEAVVHPVSGNPFGQVKKIPGVDPSGMAVCLAGRTLYYGASHTIYSFDVSDPMAPVRLDTLDICGSVRQLTEKDGYLYVGCRETGAWIIDARDPSSMELVTRYDAVELATGVETAGDVLFLSLRQNGVECVDISDKAHPQHILLQKTDESQSSCYCNGILYSGDWKTGHISVIDVRDMSDERLVRMVPLHGYGDGVCVQGNRLFVSTGHHMLRMDAGNLGTTDGNGHALEIFDISDPLDPKPLSRTQFDKYFARGDDYWTNRANSDGSVVFCADTFNGLYAVDVESGSIIGHISFENGHGTTTPCSSLALGDGVVYVSARKYGLAAIRCPLASRTTQYKETLPMNTGFRFPYETPDSSHFYSWKPSSRSQVRSVASYGKYLYAACSDGGIQVLKPRRKGRVKVVGCASESWTGDLAVRGDTLYAAEGMDGLAVYKIVRNGAKLHELSRKTDFGSFMEPMCIWVCAPDNNHLMVSDRITRVFLDRASLEPVSKIFNNSGWDRYYSSGVCKGNLFPMVWPCRGFRWIDMNGIPEEAEDLRNLNDVPFLTNGVCNYKDGAILISDGRIKVLEPGQKADRDGNPWPGAGNHYEGAPKWDGNERLAISHRIGKEITLVDISDEGNPVDIWSEKTYGNPETAIFWKGRMVVPCGYQGVLIQKDEE